MGTAQEAIKALRVAQAAAHARRASNGVMLSPQQKATRKRVKYEEARRLCDCEVRPGFMQVDPHLAYCNNTNCGIEGRAWGWHEGHWVPLQILYWESGFINHNVRAAMEEYRVKRSDWLFDTFTCYVEENMLMIEPIDLSRPIRK